MMAPDLNILNLDDIDKIPEFGKLQFEAKEFKQMMKKFVDRIKGLEQLVEYREEQKQSWKDAFKEVVESKQAIVKYLKVCMKCNDCPCADESCIVNQQYGINISEHELQPKKDKEEK